MNKLILLLFVSLPAFAAEKPCVEYLANETQVRFPKDEDLVSGFNRIKPSEVYELAYQKIDGKDFLFIFSLAGGRMVYHISGRTPVKDGNQNSVDTFDLDVRYAGYLEAGSYGAGFWLYYNGKIADRWPAYRRHPFTAHVRADFNRQTGKMVGAIGSVDLDVGNQKFFVEWENQK